MCQLACSTVIVFQTDNSSPLRIKEKKVEEWNELCNVMSLSLARGTIVY